MPLSQSRVMSVWGLDGGGHLQSVLATRKLESERENEQDLRMEQLQ